MIVDLWINGKRWDLYSDVNIKHTLQVNDIADVKDQQASFTNSFSSPKTPNNIQIAQGLGVSSDTSRFPYEKPSCQMKLEGFDFITKGWINLTETDDDYKIYIYSGIIEFVKSIENKFVGKDLSFNDITPYKGLTEIVQSWANPNVKYFLGSYGGNTHFTDGADAVIDADYLFPSINLKFLWDKLFSASGFTYSGSIFSDEDFTNLWIPYPKGRTENFYPDFLFAEGFENLKFTDVIKEIVGIFGLTMYPDKYSKNIHFKTIDERFKNAEVVDWSSKYVARTSENYVYDTYAQVNNFQFKYNKEGEQYNNGSLLIANKNIPDSKTVYSSKFYTFEQETAYYQLGSDFFLSPIFKLVDMQKGNDGEITYKALDNRFMLIRSEKRTDTIKLGSGTMPFVPFEYSGDFYITSSKDLSFQFFVDKYYNGLYNVLNSSRIHDITLNLNLADLLHLDESKLYYFRQEQQAYILNKLNYSEDNQKGEFVKAVRYEDFDVVSPKSTIKFRDFTDTTLSGYALSIPVQDMGYSNLGARTVTEVKWIGSNPSGSFEFEYIDEIHHWSIEQIASNAIYLKSLLSDGTIIYSNILVYNNIIEKYCYVGIWELDDPVHPTGGKVVFIDFEGVEQTQTNIWDTTVVTIYAQQIISAQWVTATDCP